MKVAHTVEDIVFGRTASSLVCSCEAQIDAPTPEGLEEKWHAHRRKHGLSNGVSQVGRSVGPKARRQFNPYRPKVGLPARS